MRALSSSPFVWSSLVLAIAAALAIAATLFIAIAYNRLAKGME